MPLPLSRRLVAEGLGTALLLAAVVGSGIMGDSLASGKAIQELLGHHDLSMTQRYMHLSPAALDAAIRLLDGPQRGDILETAGSTNR